MATHQARSQFRRRPARARARSHRRIACEPRCAHFGVCGGCVLQHLAPRKQLEFKQHQLFEALERIGRVTPRERLPPLQADAWHYRRRARLAARWVPKKARRWSAFASARRPTLLICKRCEVLTSRVARLIEPLSVLITALSVRDRVPQIEVSRSQTTAIALVIRVLSPLTEADRGAASRLRARRTTSSCICSPAVTRRLRSSMARPPSCRIACRSSMCDLQFQPTDFIQVNARSIERMVERAIELLAADGEG